MQFSVLTKFSDTILKVLQSNCILSCSINATQRMAGRKRTEDLLFHFIHQQCNSWQINGHYVNYGFPKQDPKHVLNLASRRSTPKAILFRAMIENTKNKTHPHMLSCNVIQTECWNTSAVLNQMIPPFMHMLLFHPKHQTTHFL